MLTHLSALRAAHKVATQAGPLSHVEPDLDREAGMDGNYGHLLQAARMLDTAGRRVVSYVVMADLTLPGVCGTTPASFRLHSDTIYAAEEAALAAVRMAAASPDGESQILGPRGEAVAWVYTGKDPVIFDRADTALAEELRAARALARMGEGASPVAGSPRA